MMLRSPDTSGAGRMVHLPCYMSKRHLPNPDFFGRKAVLQSLQDTLTPPESIDDGVAFNGPRTFALCGIGGVGKTEIAVEYAHQSRNDFDAIFFLQASDSQKLAQGFVDIALELGLVIPTAANDQAACRDAVMGWLSQPLRRLKHGFNIATSAGNLDTKWLIVFDNADNVSILRDYWPVSGDGSILLTSRDPLAKTRSYMPIEKGLDVEPFTAIEAGSLLRELTGYRSDKDRETSEMIAKRLSGLPLAITQIARFILRHSLSLEELLALYGDPSLRLELYRTEVGLSSKNLYTVWSFEDLSLEAVELLKLISFLDPDHIPEDLLTGMIGHDDKDSKNTAQAYPKSMKSFMDARTELARSSLVRRNIELKTLIILRIVQDAIRVRLNTTELRRAFQKTLNLLYSSWSFSELEHDITRWQFCKPIVPHIRSLHHLYENHESLRNRNTAKPELAQLLMDFGQ